MHRFQTKFQSVAIPGVANLLIRSLLNRDQFADPDGAAERLGISSAQWPLFGQLWPSALHLAALVGQRKLCGQRILELGCGLALPSLVAHRLGADVTASDVHPETLSFLTENLRLNQLPPMKYLHRDWQPDVRDLDGHFGLVMASDVLYEQDPAGRLAECIANRTSTDGEAWIVDPNRGHRPRFTRHMRELGFAVAETTLHSQASPEAEAYRGRLLRYSRLPATVMPTDLNEPRDAAAADAQRNC